MARPLARDLAISAMDRRLMRITAQSNTDVIWVISPLSPANNKVRCIELPVKQCGEEGWRGGGGSVQTDVQRPEGESGSFQALVEN